MHEYVLMMILPIVMIARRFGCGYHTSYVTASFWRPFNLRLLTISNRLQALGCLQLHHIVFVHCFVPLTPYHLPLKGSLPFTLFWYNLALSPYQLGIIYSSLYELIISKARIIIRQWSQHLPFGPRPFHLVPSPYV